MQQGNVLVILLCATQYWGVWSNIINVTGVTGSPLIFWRLCNGDKLKEYGMQVSPLSRNERGCFFC